MRWLASRWPGIVAYLWLTVVASVWGFGIALLVGASMLAVALVALWEAGKQTAPTDLPPLQDTGERGGR